RPPRRAPGKRAPRITQKARVRGSFRSGGQFRRPGARIDRQNRRPGPVALSSMSSYVEAVRDGVVIFDGATGTNLQMRDASADDFGGFAQEGCWEVLADTRPDIIADLHR